MTLFFGSERKDRCGTRLVGLKRFAEEQAAKLMQTNRRTWQSFDEMRQAAEQGDAAAQCYFGICYQTGQGVPQQYEEAVRWFRKAADQNDSAALLSKHVATRPADWRTPSLSQSSRYSADRY